MPAGPQLVEVLVFPISVHCVEEAVVTILRQNCRTRVEYVTIPLEGSPLPLPAPTPITVGGATIFVFDVERYEEL